MKFEKAHRLILFIFLTVFSKQVEAFNTPCWRKSYSDSAFQEKLWGEGKVMIYGKIKNIKANQNLITIKHTNIITNTEEVHTCKINGKGEYSLSVSVHHYLPELRFLFGSRNETFTAYPNDTVGVFIDSDNLGDAGIAFFGNRKTLQIEQRKFAKYFQSARKHYINESMVSRSSEKEFKRYRLTIKIKDDSVFKKYKEVFGASKSLQEIVLLDNKYSCARDLVAYNAEHAPPLFTRVEENYYDFVNADLLNNDRAILSPNYIQFISLYRSDIVLANNKQDLPIVNAVNFALQNDKSLNKGAVEIFSTFVKNNGYLSTRSELDSLNRYIDNDHLNRFNQAFLIDLNYRRINEKIKEGIGKEIALSVFLHDQLQNNNVLEDSILYRFSKEVKNQMFQHTVFEANNNLTKKISRIDIEKSFAGKILDVQADQFLKKLLSSYKGRVVYIDFWATWCQPCIQEMRRSKVTKEKFRQVAFVYLCEKSPEGRWKFTVKDEDIGGDHYLLNSSQSDYLSRKYSIFTIPRYFLINKEGEIINDQAPSPASIEGINTLSGLL